MTASERWRLLLRALKVARDVSACGGPRAAAIAFAHELTPADVMTRLDALALLASLAAKGHWGLPRVADVRDVLDSLPQPTVVPIRRKTVRHFERRDPLPVDAARAVPLDQLMKRLGVELQRRGRSVTAKCPFHNDRRPSLRVDVRKGLWFWFPCNVGGDGIELVMRLRGLTFADAVREVAA